MKIRRNISVDLETNEKLKKLAKKSHRNVSQWITEQVWQRIEEGKLANRSERGQLK